MRQLTLSLALAISGTIGPVAAEVDLRQAPDSYTCAVPGDPVYSYVLQFDGADGYTVTDASGSATGTWAVGAAGAIGFAGGALDGLEARPEGDDLLVPTLDADVTFRCTLD